MKKIGEELRNYFKERGISQSDIARELRVSQPYINALLSDKRAFGKKQAQIFSDKYGLSPNWLLTGEGNITTNDIQSIVTGKVIRYWQDIDATCGGTEIFTDSDTAKIINLQIPDFKDCTDAINIYGDSMYPQYKNGQIILLKKWNESYIDYGCAYLIITSGGHRMVKQLRKSKQDDMVVCYSVNPDFESFEIAKKDIISLWLVKGSIDKSNI